MQIDLVEDTHFNQFVFALVSVELGLIEAMIIEITHIVLKIGG
jgi:hypothetical protein